MNIGGLYSFDQDFTKVGGELIFQPGQGLSVSSANDTWAIYWSGWQYLIDKDAGEKGSDKPIDVADGRPDHRGLGIFARAGVADQDTNPIKWSASIGVGGRGMIPSRDQDIFGVGYYYTKAQETRISGPLGVADHSQGVEAFYNVAITPATHLTFDVQVLDSALSDVDTSVIIGMRLNLAF
jgi:porin